MPQHRFKQPAGRLEQIEIPSRALAGNLLGDPTTRTAAVYLPPGHDAAGARLPLFVFLAGFTGSGLKLLAWQGFAESVPQRIDRLIAEKKMGPIVAVFPDCFTSLGGNQYVNSSALGLWEDFLLDEMIPALERKYRVLDAPAGRVVLGKSSGGYGALVQGLLHGERWGAVACHSGDIGFDLVYRQELPRALDELARHDGDVTAFMEHLRKQEKIGSGEMHTLMLLAMAATYDPDPDAPFGVRLPVDPHTCELIEARWSQWLRHDPLRMIDRPECRKNLDGLSGLFIDCGFKDQYALHYGARALVRKLEALGIDHRYEEFEDNHSGIDYRMDVSLPFLYEAVTSRGRSATT